MVLSDIIFGSCILRRSGNVLRTGAHPVHHLEDQERQDINLGHVTIERLRIDPTIENGAKERLESFTPSASHIDTVIQEASTLKIRGLS